MENNECPFSEKLYLYIDGELEESEAQDVEAHLSECPICTREAELLRGFENAVQGDIPIPGDFTAKTMGKIREPLNAREIILSLVVSALFIGVFFFVHGADPLPAFGALLSKFVIFAKDHAPFRILNELLAQNSTILVSYMVAMAAIMLVWKRKPILER